MKEDKDYQKATDTMLIIYVAFFAMIGLACFATKSAWPLFALLLTPSMRARKGPKKCPKCGYDIEKHMENEG